MSCDTFTEPTRPRDRRALWLGMVFTAAVGLAACGRASQNDIFNAVGVTPTPTQSAVELAAATDAAVASAATSTARAVAAASSPDSADGALALGDISRGEATFNNFCINCHRPGGTGPDLLAPGGPGTGITVESLTILLREGTNHPPGPYPDFSIPDSAIPNIAAYIADGAGE